MPYVTQGTVQVKLKTVQGKRETVTDAEIYVSPTPDYAVKHDGKEYIVLVDAQSSPPQSKVFDKTTPFAVDKFLVETLTEAAFKGTKIEITMEASSTRIEALKIPAMP
jgi:hypothetical protein